MPRRDGDIKKPIRASRRGLIPSRGIANCCGGSEHNASRHDGIDAPSDHPADLAKIQAWIAASSPRFEDSAFWRDYARTPDPAFRLRALVAWVERKPSQPLPMLRGGRSVSPARLRVLVTIAYLRGRQTPPGVARIARPWTWTEIEDHANTYAEQPGDLAREWGAFESKARERFHEAVEAQQHVVYGCPSDLASRLFGLLGSVVVGVSTGVETGRTTAKRDATLALVTPVDDGQGD